MRIPRALIALPVVLTLGLTLGGPTAVADPPAPPGTKASIAGQDHRAEKAEQALARVEALLDGRGHRRGGADARADRRSLTIALRDLTLLRDALSPEQQARVDEINARPARDATSCSLVICVHYRTAGNDAPDLTDTDGDGAPDYVELVRDTVQQVHDDYVAAGYRRPVPDGNRGGSLDKVDIYIADLATDTQVLYGYCTTDDPKAFLDPPPTWDVWAFCALDDDYHPDEFGTANTPTENMQVTAAHEYFHAVQYAYDFGEDGWILESTATWVEDEMFDGVNDNRAYLSNGPLGAPYIPLDTFGEGFHYGTWIWWRYLTEKFPAKTGRLPKLVLDVWKRLDGAAGGPDRYSTQGLSQVLNGRGTSIKKELQLFFAANRHPGTVYDEGNAYNPSPTALNVGFSGAQTKGVRSKPFHMASYAVKLNPNGLSQRDWKLRLSFNAPDTARGGAFVVIVNKKGGGISTTLVRLNRSGGGSKTVPFSSRTIKHVDVLFVNTSTRFRCFVPPYDSPYSCLGIPRDDGLRSVFTGRAFRS